MKKLILLGLLITFKSFSCADNIEEPAFGATNYPDLPFNNFAAGHLGVITPRLATSYLTVAYRYFNHQPLSAMEQTDVLDVWHDYFSEQSAYPQPVYSLADTIDKFCSYSHEFNDEVINSNNLEQFINTIISQNKAYFNWREYRLSVLDLPTKLPTPDPNGQYSVYDIRSFYSTLALQEDNINEIDAGPGFNYLVLATERLRVIKEALDKQKGSPNSPEKTATPTEKEILSLE